MTAKDAGNAADPVDAGSAADARDAETADERRQEAQAATDAHGGAGSELAPEVRLAVDPLIDDPQTRIVVCCGSGGVGKTTTAAALGVRAAERGRKAVVLTIDPARRLAQSMGLSELDNTPRPVPGTDGTAGGELHAMMLDMKRTFDEIVESHADAERARAILNNPFYQSLSAGFAGTQEYMAMEKLGQLRARGASPGPEGEGRAQAGKESGEKDGGGEEWDLIVVDTPPSRSALDFLDAPKRLGSFLDGKFIKLLMAPAKVGGRAGMKFVNLGMAGLSIFTGALNKLLGTGLLKDVQTFVAAMDTMFGGFRARADATYQLLQAPGTAFLVVAAPERDALREAAYFVERLAADRMPLAGLVLNRTHSSAASGLSAERALAAAENLEESGIVDRGSGKVNLRGAPSPGATPTLTDDTDLTHTEKDGPHADAARAKTTRANAQEPEPQEQNSRDEKAQGKNAPQEPPQPSRSQDELNALAAGLLRVHAERMRLLTRERRTRDRFIALHPEVPVTEVTALPSDVHDLAGLRAIGDRLAADPGNPAR